MFFPDILLFTKRGRLRIICGKCCKEGHGRKQCGLKRKYEP